MRNGGAGALASVPASDERHERYLMEYEIARLGAVTALLELERILSGGASTKAVAVAARRNHLASARLYAAAQCLVSPP